MGIFESKNKTNNPNSTKGFYFGAPEAEAENIDGYKLIDYFDDYLEILDNLEKGKFIFVGRKGVGKSAITKFIKDKSDDSQNSFATILRLSDFEIEKSIQVDTDNFKRDILLFEWLILVNIVKLVVKNNCGPYTNEFIKLKKFLDNNSGIVDVDKFQIDEVFKKTGGEINFGVLTHTFGGVFKKYFDIKVSKAPFYKLIPPLKEVVKIILDYDINKKTEFWLLFDDLDINFNIYEEADKTKVIELIRLAKSYNNEIFKNNKAKILIFIREDVRNKLIAEYNDSAKIFNSYEIHVNWYNHLDSTIDENRIALKRMINKRIEINFKNKKLNYGEDPWYNLFSNENMNPNTYPKKTTFKYLIDFTFYRPRDLITILNIVSSQDFSYPISPFNIKVILEKYINTNINEIKSELNLFFNENDKAKIFNSLFKFVSDYPIKSYNQVFEKIESLDFSLKSETIIDLLISYSFLIPSNLSGDLFFSYRDNVELDKIKKEDLNINLPKNIYHYYKQIN